MINPIEEIRSALSEALKDSVLNIDRVIELSNKLAQLDPNQVRFSTDAGIISRLGRELVAKQETAVAELIKNSYDADATEVTLAFEQALEAGGNLTIEDNGVGMTRDQLISGFMRLSSADKIDNPTSPIYDRRRAGRKGIGRFAVQRLGTFLTIVSQTTSSDSALKIEIDWKAFTNGKDLISIASNITAIPKERESGTTLVIKDLSEGWSDAEVRRSYRYVLDLLQPFPLNTSLSKNQQQVENIKHIDPGFNVKILRYQNGKAKIISDEQQSIYSYAIADIEAQINGQGEGISTVNSKQFDIKDEIFKIDSQQDTSSFLHLNNIRLKVYYFIWQPDLYPRSIYKVIRELGQEKAGIRVYRNGFRVRPYGERKDDWLELDASTAARDILPPHANINFFGFVEIIDTEGLSFNETSSREGLIENDAFRELQDFCSRVLKAAVLRIAVARGRKQTKSQRDWEKEKGPLDDVIRGAAERLKTVFEEQKQKESSKSKIRDDYSDQEDTSNSYDSNKANFDNSGLFREATQLAEEILKANELRNQKDQTQLQELGMLRVLASLGLTIGEFTHEVRQTLDAAKLDAQYLVKNLSEGSKEYKRAIRLDSNIQRFTTYAAYFDKAIRENISRELIPQNLKIVVRSFVELVEPTASQMGIEVTKEIMGQDLLTLPMHASELASILFNFYSNSQKAIKRTNTKGRIHIWVGTESNKLILEFADNGDGIPATYQDRVFNAFFTTSTSTGLNTAEEEEMQGTGLGLKIVKDIVEGYNGEVYISSPPKDFTTCFRVELPLNIDTELHD